jgi:hypothetical protein
MPSSLLALVLMPAIGIRLLRRWGKGDHSDVSKRDGMHAGRQVEGAPLGSLEYCGR